MVWTREEEDQKRWEVTVETQRHFNKLIIQARVFGSTILVAFVTVAAQIALEKNAFLLAAAVQLFTILFLIGVWILDSYYWSLLIAAVEFGEELEKMRGLPIVRIGEIEAHGLTDYISKKVKENQAELKQNAFYTLLLAVQIALLIAYLVLHAS